MKIALVCPYDFAHPGGVGIHISCLAENFAQMGHSVRILASSSRPKDELGYDNLAVIGRPISIRSGGSVARMTISPRVSGPIKRILKEENFDLIHIHEPLLPSLPLNVLRFSKTINIGTFHAYHGKHRGYGFWKFFLKRWWFPKLHGKIAVSRPALEFVSRYFPGEYTIIPNGIDVEHFSNNVAPIEEYCDGKLNILSVGRLERRKGVEHLLEAYHLAKRELPESRLLIVGPAGGLREELERIIYEKGLRDVVFVGYMSYDELARFYKTADIFCAPATGKESFGIVLLEAMAASKPIVAASNEGYSGIVSHGVDGLLVEPGEEVGLANSLLQLAGDKSLREEMGARGKLKAQSYSWERVARQVMDYYEEVMSETPLEM